MNTIACPCCGSPMSTSDDLAPLRHVKLTPGERDVLDAFVERYPRTVSTASLIDRLYQLDPNGGPGQPRNVIGVHVHDINKAIKPLGWRLTTFGHSARLLVRLA